MTDIIRDARDARERLKMAECDAREVLERRVEDIRRLVARGAGWDHPSVRTARSRLTSALADLAVLELITRPVSTEREVASPDDPSPDHDIPPLTTRNGR